MRADVVVIGAGIMGVSTAYHLARRGAGRIVVLERDSVCSGSTALASGGIGHQYANRVGIELTRAGIETFERFEAMFGVDPSFRQHGYLILVTTAIAARAGELGVEIRTGHEVVEVERAAGRVSGVVTRDARIESPVVVIAAGAWSAAVGQLAGVEIPVSPLRRSKFITA